MITSTVLASFDTPGGAIVVETEGPLGDELIIVDLDIPSLVEIVFDLPIGPYCGPIIKPPPVTRIVKLTMRGIARPLSSSRHLIGVAHLSSSSASTTHSHLMHYGGIGLRTLSRAMQSAALSPGSGLARLATRTRTISRAIGSILLPVALATASRSLAKSRAIPWTGYAMLVSKSAATASMATSSIAARLAVRAKSAAAAFSLNPVTIGLLLVSAVSRSAARSTRAGSLTSIVAMTSRAIGAAREMRLAFVGRTVLSIRSIASAFAKAPVIPGAKVALTTASRAGAVGMASTGNVYFTAISFAMGSAIGPELPVLEMEGGGDVQIEGGGRIILE